MFKTKSFLLAVGVVLAVAFTFSCSSDDDKQICAGEEYDSSIYRCESGELIGKCMGKDYYTAYEICNNGAIEDKYGSFTDSRDKQVYKWVKIGNQTWMAENLNFNSENSECLLEISTNCEIYGREYDWTTAMSACPSGWHLPSDKEWATLIDKVGGEDIAGTKLKAKSENGSDEYGFSALLADYCKEIINGNCDYGEYYCLAMERACLLPGRTPHKVGEFYALWWTATEVSDDYYFYDYVYAWIISSDRFMFHYENDKSSLLYVRCLKDN
jgi:uncharacterized protein (TIGR02145 family)